MKLNTINDLHGHTAPLAQALTEAIQRVLSSGWFVLGPEVRAFETEFAEYCGVSRCVGVACGTDALELLLRALGVGVGDEVITVANAGMYSTTAILATGAEPVYADLDPQHLTLCPESASRRITARTRAMIATHLFGRMADMPSLNTIAHQHGIALVEDCAQAHGASLQGRPAGSWGTGAAFSFYPTKNLGALGDAGAVVTSNTALAARVEHLRQYGWGHKYTATVPGGRNSRLDELQAAVLRVKLRYLDEWNTRRRAVAACYDELITQSCISKPSIDGEDYVAHLYVIRISNRDALRDHLAQHGIATDVHYPLLDYQQPCLVQRYRAIQLPVSEHVVRQVLTLPCYPELDLDDVRQICTMLNRWKN